jgi:hypothetical protein
MPAWGRYGREATRLLDGWAELILQAVEATAAPG